MFDELQRDQLPRFQPGYNFAVLSLCGFEIENALFIT